MPAIDIYNLLLQYIVAGQTVDPTIVTTIIADNGVEVCSAIQTDIVAANGTATSIQQVVDTTATEVVTSGSSLLAVDVGVAGAAIAPALGVAAGVGLYNLAPEFWTDVSNTLVDAGCTIGGKVISFFNSDGQQSYPSTVINIIKNALIEAGIFEVNYEMPELTAAFNFKYGNRSDTVTLDRYNQFKNLVRTNFVSSYVSSGIEYFVEWSECSFRLNGVYYKPDIIRSLLYYSGNNSNYGITYLLTFSDTSMVNNTYTLVDKNGNNVGATYLSFTTFEVPIDGTFYPKIAVATTQITNNDYYRTYYNLPQPNQLPSGSAALAHIFTAIMLMMSGSSPNLQPDATYPSSSSSVETTYPTWDPTIIPGVSGATLPVEYPWELPDQQQAQNPEPVPSTDPEKWWDSIKDQFILPTPSPDPEPGPINPQPVPEPDPDPVPEPEPVPTPGDMPSTPDPIDPNPEPGSDLTPVVPILPDTHPSNALFTVYHPTNAQLNSLGRYLWSTSIIDQIQKIWQNPLEGIISLKKIYATPTDGSPQFIMLGNILTDIPAPVITTQFQTIDCGSVSIPEEKQNSTDYSPYTSVHLYLPFIGIVELDTSEVMNSMLHIIYGVDFYTGTCLAQVFVSRNPDILVEKILYQFSGNCAQEIPLTASTSMGLANALVTLGASAISIASGGALGAAAATSAIGHSLSHELVHVGHSGSLSSNAGIMGQKKPYVIVGRRHQYDANQYNSFWGYPCNTTCFLGNCSGYTRVKAINLQTAATQEEKDEIEQLLKDGVIF